MSPWNRELVRASLAGLRFDEPKPLPRRAAVAIVLHLDPEEQGTEVLLMKRVERQGDPWSGQISLPGGRFEPEDPDLLATAIRETEEELGIDLVQTAVPVGRLEPLRARARGKIQPLDVSPFVFLASSRLTARVPGDEAEDAFWFPLERATSGSFDGIYMLQHEGNEIEMPSWGYSGHTIWGMTHRILSGLIELLGDD